MKLFAVYLGGYIDGGHVELHDVRFVVGEKIEDTYAQLQEQWIGKNNDFHIDAYMEIKNIDGYKISLTKNQSENIDEKLYFVFMGAYDENFFGELHEIAFFVGQDDISIKKRALSELCELCAGTKMPHRDTQYDIDSIIEIMNAGDWHVSLEYVGGESQPLKPDWFGYNIDVQK